MSGRSGGQKNSWTLKKQDANIWGGRGNWGGLLNNTNPTTETQQLRAETPALVTSARIVRPPVFRLTRRVASVHLMTIGQPSAKKVEKRDSTKKYRGVCDSTQKRQRKERKEKNGPTIGW